MTSFKLVTPPATEPVALADMKAHLRVDTDAEDTLIATLIVAARQWAESYTRRAFITQTWQAWLDREDLKGDALALPKPPLLTVNSAQYYDENGNATEWAESNYYVDTSHEPGRLALLSGGTWPIPSRSVNGVMIGYDAGYGENATDVPETIRLAIKQIVAHWYEHRGEAVIMSASRHDAIANVTGVNMPLVIQALLDPYRIIEVRG